MKINQEADCSICDFEKIVHLDLWYVFNQNFNSIQTYTRDEALRRLNKQLREHVDDAQKGRLVEEDLQNFLGWLAAAKMVIENSNKIMFLNDHSFFKLEEQLHLKLNQLPQYHIFFQGGLPVYLEDEEYKYLLDLCIKPEVNLSQISSLRERLRL